jgi:hypothetical protein
VWACPKLELVRTKHWENYKKSFKVRFDRTCYGITEQVNEQE